MELRLQAVNSRREDLKGVDRRRWLEINLSQKDMGYTQ